MRRAVDDGARHRKLYDIHDVAVSVAANSANGDVTGDLVDVGLGTRAEDYDGQGR